MGGQDRGRTESTTAVTKESLEGSLKEGRSLPQAAVCVPAAHSGHEGVTKKEVSVQAYI